MAGKDGYVRRKLWGPVMDSEPVRTVLSSYGANLEELEATDWVVAADDEDVEDVDELTPSPPRRRRPRSYAKPPNVFRREDEDEDDDDDR